MIAPDMATMLSFVVTDLPVAAPLLQELLSRAVGSTFNAITVDSDTSTSDTLMLFSAWAKGVKPVKDEKDVRVAPPSGRRCRKCCMNWRCWWCATARARASRSKSR